MRNFLRKNLIFILIILFFVVIIGSLSLLMIKYSFPKISDSNNSSTSIWGTGNDYSYSTGTAKVFNNCRSFVIVSSNNNYFEVVSSLNSFNPSNGDIIGGNFQYVETRMYITTYVNDITKNKELSILVDSSSSDPTYALKWIYNQCVNQE